jgi:hypothetical protein
MSLLWILLFLDPVVCDAFHYECWLNVRILVHIHSGEAALECISDLYHTFSTHFCHISMVLLKIYGTAEIVVIFKLELLCSASRTTRMTVCSLRLFVNSVVPDDGEIEKNASMYI